MSSAGITTFTMLDDSILKKPMVKKARLLAGLRLGKNKDELC